MTNEHSFKAGDRVLCTDKFHTTAPGTVVEVATTYDFCYSVRLDTPTRHCFFEGNTVRYFAPEMLSAAPAVETPPAPFAVSSKPRPKAPIKPGSRHEQVLKHLTTGKSLTQGEAILLGYGTRVAATVHDLRRRGHNITTTMKEDIHGAPYAEYRLVTRGANGNRKAA